MRLAGIRCREDGIGKHIDRRGLGTAVVIVINSQGIGAGQCDHWRERQFPAENLADSSGPLVEKLKAFRGAQTAQIGLRKLAGERIQAHSDGDGQRDIFCYGHRSGGGTPVTFVNNQEVIDSRLVHFRKGGICAADNIAVGRSPGKIEISNTERAAGV